ncbi:TPA: glycosyltransferase family 25 protein [Providencia stuartii]|uniref:glycosyltransferase family 25 protein n=1 Tax=Providencia stuartii TaxID=588 RepID=UPI002DB59D96|nr:glycosyltransferase family 25 protein [Providencia stuartii]WRV51448.1 glycosyltransferase family 25 protein [Providencia stuartii]
MKIYVLSLKKSKRRTIFSQNNLFLSDNYVFFDAVEGKLLPNDYIININKLTKRYKRDIGRNEIACADSHIAIYQNMIKENIEWAIIFEDDVIIDKKISQLITHEKSKLNKMSIYILGGQDGLSSKDMIITSKKDNIVVSDCLELKKTIASSKYIYRTCCYLIHVELARKIVEKRKTHFFLADDWDFLYKNKIINHFYISDCVTHPIDLDDSVIQNERNTYRTKSIIFKLKNSKLRNYKIKLRKIIYG